MISYHGGERRDENNNQQAEIYSLLQTANNSEPFHLRINAFHRRMIERGFVSIPRSAYLKYHLFDLTLVYERPIERIRRHLSMTPEVPRGQNDHDMVFIWDIGDITMLTRDHIGELRIIRPDINSTKLYNLRESICEGVNGLERAMDIIRKVDNIEDALFGETDAMKRAAPVYDALRELYNSVKSNDVNGKMPNISHDLLEKLGILGQENELCQIVEKHQKVYHQRWKYAKKSLELVNRRSAKSETKKYANVIISEEGVASAAAQLMLSGLSSSIPIENIYSMNTLPGEVDKPIVVCNDLKRYARTSPVVDRIRRRFGDNCCLVYISTDGRVIGYELEIWRIAANESIKKLYDLQKDTLN